MASKATNRPSKESNNNLGSQIQNKLRKTGLQIFKNVENRLKGTNEPEPEVEPTPEPEVKSPTSSNPNPLEFLGPLSFKTAKLLISALHAWNIEKNLDKYLIEKLFLKIPRWPILFGIIRSGTIVLDLPGKTIKIFENN